MDVKVLGIDLGKTVCSLQPSGVGCGRVAVLREWPWMLWAR